MEIIEEFYNEENKKFEKRKVEERRLNESDNGIPIEDIRNAAQQLERNQRIGWQAGFIQPTWQMSAGIISADYVPEVCPPHIQRHIEEIANTIRVGEFSDTPEAMDNFPPENQRTSGQRLQ